LAARFFFRFVVLACAAPPLRPNLQDSRYSGVGVDAIRGSHFSIVLYMFYLFKKMSFN
jgi:hypothetical protein